MHVRKTLNGASILILLVPLVLTGTPVGAVTTAPQAVGIEAGPPAPEQETGPAALAAGQAGETMGPVTGVEMGPATLDPAADLAGSRPAGEDSRGPSLFPWVDTPVTGLESGMTNRALALDGQGNPHLVYSGTDLRYAYWDGSSWHSEVVDRVRSFPSASLALDADDHAHVSYVDNYGNVKYAYHDGVQWKIELICSAEIYLQGNWTSLVLDASGYPRISYDLLGDGGMLDELRYAYWNGTDWIDQVAWTGASHGIRGMYPSLALDSAGQPHISYQYSTDGGVAILNYASYDGTGWIIETIDWGGGKYSSLVLDAADRPHVAYVDDSDPQIVRYAWYNGSAWEIEVIGEGTSPSLVLGPGEQPMLAYGGPVLPYAVRTDNGWLSQVVDGGRAYNVSLALDTTGRPRLCYYLWAEQKLKFASYDNAAWTTSVMNDAGESALYLSLALDGNDFPHFTHCLISGTICSALEYGSFDGTAWQYRRVAGNLGDKGGRSSLKIGTDGRPRLAYTDNHLGTLQYAYLRGTTWITETIDRGGFSLSETSLALDAAGRPSIAYTTHWGQYPSSLRFARFDGTRWLTETVDPDGAYPSLALDASGRPHLAYYGRSAMLYSFFDGTSWITQTIRPIACYGYCSENSIFLVLDSAGQPHVGFPGGYAFYDGTNWQIETMAGQGGADGGFALDALNRPHLASYDHEEGEIRYAYRDASGWHVELVARAPQGASAVALDRLGRPHLMVYSTSQFHYLYRLHPYRPAPWIAELVDVGWDEATLHNRGLAIDADGHAHLAYGGTQLYYAEEDGAGWHVQVVDPTYGVNRDPSLVLDGNGRPHIVYQASEGESNYAYYNGQGWQIQSLNDIEPSGWIQSPSLTVDAAGHPHLAYTRENDLVYAYYDGDTWHTEHLDSGAYPSLVLDSSGYPHLSYFGPPDLLKYATYDGTSWQIAVVCPFYDEYEPHFALALDLADRPHIIYLGPFGMEVLHAYLGDTVWISETIESSEEMYFAPSVATDTAGRLHVSYFRGGTPGVLQHALYDGSSWTIQPVIADYYWIPMTSLALNSADEPRISYYRQESGELNLATWTGSAWAYSSIDRRGSSGTKSSLALSATGQPYLSYEWGDGNVGGIKYAYYNGQVWNTELVISSSAFNNWLGFSSLALDSTDRPHMSYLAPFNGGLGYASLGPNGWEGEVVDPEFTPMNGGNYASLVLDAVDRPHISYCGLSRNQQSGCSLRYAYYDGSVWTTTVVDASSDNVGSFNSLALDSAAQPHIGYYDAYSHSVRYAYLDGGSWVTETIDSYLDDVRGPVALAMDHYDRPHLVYAGWYGLRYAYRDGAVWTIEEIDSDRTGGMGTAVALHLDSLGYPHIVYQRTSGVFMYAYFDGKSWQAEQIGVVESAERDPFLSLDEDGLAHVTFLAFLGGSLDGLEYTRMACRPVAEVELDGRGDLLVGEEAVYTATYYSPLATAPVGVRWNNGALGSTAAYSWTVPGTYTVAVTVDNPCVQVGAVYTVTVLPSGPLDLLALLSFDNDLSPYAPEVLDRFRLGTAANPAVRVTLLLDQKADGDSEVVEIADGIITHTGAIPWLPGVHEVDSASPAVLRDFILWARHPGVPTVVALLGHGAGPAPEVHLTSDPGDIGSQLPLLPQFRDRTSGDVTSGTYLSTPELGRTLRGATNNGADPLTLLFLDQCFEGSLDVLYEVRDTAQVLVASPNYAWAAFAYDAYLPHLAAGATPEEMAQAIATEYEAALDEEHPNAILWAPGTTVGPLGDAVSALGDALRGELANRGPILAAVLESRYADTTLCRADLELCPPDELVGLGSFSRGLQARYPSGSAVYEAAGAVLAQLGEVHGEYRVGHPWVKPEVTWAYTDVLTVLAPLTPTLQADEAWRASIYTSTAPLAAAWAPEPARTVTVTAPLLYTAEGRWDDFLSAWYGELTPTVGLVCRATPPALVYAGEPTLTLVVEARGIGSWLEWSAYPGTASYAIYVLRPDGTTWELLDVAPGDQTTYRHVEPLLPSGDYAYLVAARDERARVLNLTGEAEDWLGIAAVVPNWGYQSEDTVVWVYGTGFVPPVTVTLDEREMGAAQVISSQVVAITVPAGLPLGWYDVRVKTEEGMVVTYDAYQVVAEPVYQVYLPLVMKE